MRIAAAPVPLTFSVGADAVFPFVIATLTRPPIVRTKPVIVPVSGPLCRAVGYLVSATPQFCSGRRRLCGGIFAAF
jgi:hypothetical protein